MSNISATQQAQKKSPLSCDQVAHISDVFDRYRAQCLIGNVGISRARETAKLAAILELMELLGLEFADDNARGNAVAGMPELRRK
jgi:hypothetical protein